jgi:CHAT domain-containing protein
MQSYVALGDGQGLPAAGEPAPGNRLRAADLMASGARGDLVVIAACVSGRNEVRPGDELLGFARALLFRGFDALVTALWSFEVQSGRRLLERFLRGWLREGLGRASALAEVQRAFLRGEFGERWRHPYFWGSFFLVGQWD